MTEAGEDVGRIVNGGHGDQKVRELNLEEKIGRVVLSKCS